MKRPQLKIAYVLVKVIINCFKNFVFIMFESHWSAPDAVADEEDPAKWELRMEGSVWSICWKLDWNAYYIEKTWLHNTHRLHTYYIWVAYGLHVDYIWYIHVYKVHNTDDDIIITIIYHVDYIRTWIMYSTKELHMNYIC